MIPALPFEAKRTMEPVICSRCKLPKVAADFSKAVSDNRSDGKRVYRDYRCKRCNAFRQREKSRTPEGQFQRAKDIARRGKLKKSWTLTFEQYASLRAKPCHYCGFPLPETGLGLDRLDHHGGYEIGNVVPCCTECNLIKGAILSVEEMSLLGKSLNAIKIARVARGANVSNPGWRRSTIHHGSDDAVQVKTSRKY